MAFLGLVEVREDGWVSTMLNFETGVLIKFSVSLNFYYSNVYITLHLLQEIPYILILQPTWVIYNIKSHWSVTNIYDLVTNWCSAWSRHPDATTPTLPRHMATAFPTSKDLSQQDNVPWHCEKCSGMTKVTRWSVQDVDPASELPTSLDVLKQASRPTLQSTLGQRIHSVPNTTGVGRTREIYMILVVLMLWQINIYLKYNQEHFSLQQTDTVMIHSYQPSFLQN